MGLLALFETAAGHALFQVLDDAKLKKSEKIHEYFESAEKANKLVKLVDFNKFKDTACALDNATSLCDQEMTKDLKKFLKKSIVKKGLQDKLAVFDPKLGQLIQKKLDIKCVADSTSAELLRGIRSQLDSLVTGLPQPEHKAMVLGLAHSLSRYKIKFSPDKVDTMIVQAISLLDELDKELNTYSMRVKEWYGWHFPEMVKIVNDNMQYARVVLKMGVRSNAKNSDLSDILEEDMEEQLKDSAEISMGTEVSDEDITNIMSLCTQVIDMAQHRAQLFEYLKNRMNAIAPNLSVMVGELVGARLIAHSGSLMNLAKSPASTVQILGAEKALFRALKTKHETPKYGLIYHASLVGQAAPKNKGKISRVLAAKTALCIRVDALGEAEGPTIAFESRNTVENRLRLLEGGQVRQLSGTARGKAQQEKYVAPTEIKSYNAADDIMEEETPMLAKKSKKDKSTKKKDKSSKKKSKKDKMEVDESEDEESEEEEKKPKKSTKKKKKRKIEETEEEVETPVKAKKSKSTKKKSTKKKKKSKQEE